MNNIDRRTFCKGLFGLAVSVIVPTVLVKQVFPLLHKAERPYGMLHLDPVNDYIRVPSSIDITKDFSITFYYDKDKGTVEFVE